jgi:hypothetical protein
MSALGQAADIIAPYISSDFRRQDRAEGAAADLDRAGLLVDGLDQPAGTLPPTEAAVNLLQCRFSWPDAEQIAAELSTAGVLREVA